MDCLYHLPSVRSGHTIPLVPLAARLTTEMLSAILIVTRNKNDENTTINIKIYSIKEFGSQREASYVPKTQAFFFS